MSVDEEGGRTQVTLLGADLFASGSATRQSGHDQTLQQHRARSTRCPGACWSIGHTDDQPLRSLRYRDNFELSRERARERRRRCCSAALDNRARIELDRRRVVRSRCYTPASDPENRARNRRVEIIHVGGL